MTTPTCEHRSDVLAALAAGRLVASASLLAHVGGCAICATAAGAGLFGDALDGALAARSDLSEDEAALLLSDWGEPMPDTSTLSADDRRRLHRAARAFDEDAGSGGPSVERRLWALGVRPSGVAEPAPARSGRPARPIAPRWMLMVAAAAVVLLAVRWSGVLEDEWRGILADTTDVARAGTVDLEIGLGERRCTGLRDPAGWAFRFGAAAPCRWPISAETFTLNVRVEPDADTRYLAVFARDDAGEVTLLYPKDAAQPSPLVTTVGRKSDLCVDGLCWLEGGRYDVVPGRLSVVAVFSTEPLPTVDMLSRWAPRWWVGPERLVQRFELEVVP